jgi:chromosome segregation ATPase
LVTVREKANERFREEQRQVAEERAVIEQWRENISKELTNGKIEIEKTEVGIYERERDIDHRESMFRQHEEHEHLSIKREKEDLKERHLTLTEYEEELKDQRIRIDVQVEDIHVERGRLQDMAEQISTLAHKLAHKAEVAEESLLKAEQMTAETEARNAALSVKQNELEKKIETIKYEKMDLARQRVEFLKERSYSRQYRQ